MDGPDSKEVRKTYGWIEPSHDEDGWHRYTSQVLSSELSSVFRDATQFQRVLNVGCGGFHYRLPLEATQCVDIIAKGRPGCRSVIVANVESLPFPNRKFEVVVCVGSVMNYTDATRCVSECARVLIPGGILVLEFERSESAAHWFKEAHYQRAWPVQTQYKGIPHRFWVYSERAVRDLLLRNRLRVVRAHHFHLLGAWVSRIFGFSPISTLCSRLDPILSSSKLMRQNAGNVLLVCRKT